MKPNNELSWKRFHLSTAMIFMLIASGLLYLNMLPIWHYAGEEKGMEIFEISGYGWPFRIVRTYGDIRPSSIDEVAIIGNLLLMTAIGMCVVKLRKWGTFESPKAFKRSIVVAGVLAFILSSLWFGWAVVISQIPVFGPLSLSISFKPWWQNWRSATVIFVLVGLLSIVSRALSSPVRFKISDNIRN